MSKRTHEYGVGEYYHCYNRGSDKRVIFSDAQDYTYFIKSLEAYNSTQVFGKLRLHHESSTEEKIVEIVSFCLLPNHFHLLLAEKIEGGISKFMQRLGTGYTMYFNEKNNRSGRLFQGVYKSKHIETDQDLRQVLAYVTYNNVVHNISNPALFRGKLNQDAEIVRGLASNMDLSANMLEVVEIIKSQRLSFDYADK